MHVSVQSIFNKINGFFLQKKAQKSVDLGVLLERACGKTVYLSTTEPNLSLSCS